MYSEITRGKKFNIQGLDCYIPPEGYVVGIKTNALEYVGIDSRSDTPSEQYWERKPLPGWYRQKMKEEDAYNKKKKEDDPPYFNEQLEEYTQKEWNRRLNGYWFMNNGDAVYLTGSHYVFLQWWQIDIGYGRFRVPDLEYFYFLQCCIEDPECMGMIEITKRRFGKCFKINTLVRMIDGSVKPVQDIKDGEFVMGNDSKPRLVYGSTSGEEELFEIIPHKGQSFTVNKSHIIYAHKTKSLNKYKKGKGKVFDRVERGTVKFTVEEYLEYTESYKKRLQIERTGWDYDERSISIDPYFLGVWLGDGMSRDCCICNEDAEVIDYLKEYAEKNGLKYHNYGSRTEKGVMIRHSLSQRNSQRVRYQDVEYDNKTSLMRKLGKHEKTPLRTLGLFKSGEVQILEYKDNWLWNEMLSLDLKLNKHIPIDYKINSRENRIRLLAGIIDADGTLVNNAHFKIGLSNKYQTLINDIVELIQSLGFYCGVRQEKNVNATVLTIFGNIHLIPTKIKRKQATQTSKKYNSLLSGFTVKSVGVDKYYGFAVDDNNLFLLSDGTVVHNTFRAGLFLYEYVTRTRNANAGIQSKTGADAKKLFGKAVIAPFKKLPRFFRPEYDMSLGVTPKTEIRFQQTNVRGKRAEETLDKEELGSIIDHQSADVVAYDGQKLHRYVADESGKTVECNVYDRHDVIRYCLLDDEGKIIGKALYTTTVEKMESDKDGVQAAFINLWDDSDQTNKGENGRTSSGMYRFFMTADRARNFDTHGYPNVEKTIKEILADRASVSHNLRALSNRIKKEARTIQEVFSTDGDKCIFNVINIDKRDEELRENPVYKRKVVFEATFDREGNRSVRWRDINNNEKSFHWEITFGLTADFGPNKFKREGTLKKPCRIDEFCIAIDGYGNNQGGRKYGSKASAWIGRKYNILDPDNTFKAIGNLYGRPYEKSKLHEQVMFAAEYFSCQAWFEHNSDEYDTYFKDRGKRLYLGVYPLSTIAPDKRLTIERHRGFPTTPFSLTRQNDVTIAYFENYCHLIDWPELLDNAKKYDPYDRTSFDMVVSFEMLIVCLMEKTNIPSSPKTPLVRVYPNLGVQSTYN